MRKDSVKRHGVLLFYRGPSLRTIERCRAQFKRFRRATPAARLERVPTFTYVQGAAIMEWVNCQSDGYSLQDVTSWFHFTFPHRVVGTHTMCRWLQYMGFTRKKRTNTAAQVFSLRLTYLFPVVWILCLKIAELRNLLAAVLPAPSTQQNTPDSAVCAVTCRVCPCQQCQVEIDIFWNKMSDLRISPCEISWMDEVGFDSRNFALLHGYAYKGWRFRANNAFPGRGRRYDALVAMGTDGIVACELFTDGTVQWENFSDFCVRDYFPAMLRRGKRVGIPKVNSKTIPHVRLLCRRMWLRLSRGCRSRSSTIALCTEHMTKKSFVLEPFSGF